MAEKRTTTPRSKAPTTKASAVKAPTTKRPEIKLDEFASDLTKVLKDAVYITVGFGVLAVQRLQVQRQELRQRVDKQLDGRKAEWEKMADRVDAQLKQVESRLTGVEERIDEVLDQVQDKLPEQAGEILGKARVAVKDARDQVLELVRREDDKAA